MSTRWGSPLAARAGTPLLGKTRIERLRDKARQQRHSDPPTFLSRRLRSRPAGYRDGRDAFAAELDARADALALALLARRGRLRA